MSLYSNWQSVEIPDQTRQQGNCVSSGNSRTDLQYPVSSSYCKSLLITHCYYCHNHITPGSVYFVHSCECSIQQWSSISRHWSPALSTLSTKPPQWTPCLPACCYHSACVPESPHSPSHCNHCVNTTPHSFPLPSNYLI